MSPGCMARRQGMYRATAILLLTLCATQFALAQAPEQPGGGNMPAGLAQKQAFVQGLVENTSAIERFQTSQDVEAINLVFFAKDSQASAIARLKNGDFAGAEKLLNEAISRWILLLSLRMHSADSVALGAKQRVERVYASRGQPPDTEAFTARLRVESKRLQENHEKLQGSIEFLETPYRDYVKRAGRSPVGVPLIEDRELARFAERMSETKMHTAMGRNDGALRSLSNVAQLVRSAMNRLLNSVTVDYTMKFESLAEEYAYELKRNSSYLELIPLVIIEFKPTDDETPIIGKLVKENYLAIEQAREYAEKQDYQRALTTVYAATGFLELALCTAGLVAPYVWLSPYDWQSLLDSGI